MTLDKQENHLNIVIVYDTASIAGGAGKIAIKSAIELAAIEKYNVYYFTSMGPVCQELKNSKVHTICLDIPIMIKNPNKVQAALYGLWNPRAYKAFYELVSPMDPEYTIVHIHGWTKVISCSIFKAIRKLNLKTVITMHDYFSVCPNGGFYDYGTNKLCARKPLSWQCIRCNCDKRSYFQKLYRCLRQTIQNNYVKNNSSLSYIYISDRIKNLNVPYLKSEKFYFVRNPVDLTKHLPKRHSASNMFLYVGRVSEEKGVEDFCKAITVAREHLDVRGVVAGNGPLLDSLKGQYPRVEFWGWQNSDQVLELYQEARVLVFPSLCNEGSPLTIPEALIFELPCIVSDCTAAVEMIFNHCNGMVYSAGDVNQLIQCISKLMDDGLIEKLQSNISREFDLDALSYEKHGATLQCVYENILKGKKDRLPPTCI